MREEIEVVGRAPAARNRVADEIHINATLLRLREEPLVGELGVGVRARRGLIGGGVGEAGGQGGEGER